MLNQSLSLYVQRKFRLLLLSTMFPVLLLTLLITGGVVEAAANLAGTFTEHTIPTNNSNPLNITIGSDGARWFTEGVGNKIGRMTATGVFKEFSIPTSNSSPNGIAAGPDGALWFTESIGNKIGRVTTAGVFTEYPIQTATSTAGSITKGPDGNLWFTETRTFQLGRITPD